MFIKLFWKEIDWKLNTQKNKSSCKKFLKSVYAKNKKGNIGGEKIIKLIKANKIVSLCKTEEKYEGKITKNIE
jgi:hypothetical protein